MVWAATKNSLAQSLMMAHIPSGYAGATQKFLDTLPKDWQNARFNTTELGASSAAIRQVVNARLANVEQENNGRPYTPANQEGLREVGIIPPSAGWDNPLAMIKSGPDALRNASDQQLEWLRNHQQMLNPAERALGKAEWARRAGQVSPQQGGTQDASQAPQVPQAPAAPSQPPPQGAAPQGAPSSESQSPPEPSPQGPQGSPYPAQGQQDTTPYAPNPQLGQNTQRDPDADDS